MYCCVVLVAWYLACVVCCVLLFVACWALMDVRCLFIGCCSIVVGGRLLLCEFACGCSVLYVGRGCCLLFGVT